MIIAVSPRFMYINPLTAGHNYIRVFFYFIEYQLSNMLKNKRDINWQDLKIIDLHSVKSE